MAQLKSGSTVGGTEIAKKDLSNVATLPVDVVAQLKGTDGRKNLMINGGFDVWQRGTSFTSTSVNEYSADRFRTEGYGLSTTISRQSFTAGQTDVLNFPTYFCRVATSTVSAGQFWGLQQRIETPQVMRYGQTVTVSFWVKATTGTLASGAFTYGLDDSKSSSPALTTTWQKITNTFTCGLSGNYSSFYLVYLGAGSAAISVDIAQVQLELGSEATDFEHRSYSEELALCQRYFEKSFNDDVAPANGSSSTTTASDDGMAAGLGSNNSGAGGSVDYKVTKRSNPTITKYGNNAGGWYYTPPTNQSSGSWSTSSGYIDHSGVNGFNFKQNISGDTLYIMYGHWTADAEL